VSHSYHGRKVTEATFFKNMKYYANKKSCCWPPILSEFKEFCVPPSVCKVETFHCLRTTVTHICLIRATLRDALNHSLFGRGMVSNSYTLSHVRAEVTNSLRLSCNWVRVHEDLLIRVMSWTSVYCIITLVFLVSRKFTHTFYDAEWFFRVHSPSQTDTVLPNR
jgi:hypothetical protein